MTKEELVNLCKEGNKQALSLLYTTYANKMKRICSQYISDKQTVNDLLHDGFIIIFTSIHTLRSPEKLESWMGKIMKNMSLRYLEQSHSTTFVSLEEIEESEVPQAQSYSTDFPSYAAMRKMIDTLPEGYREVFKLAVLEGLSHKEIGSLLNIAPHSSSSQLSRAKVLLRKLLAHYYIVITLFLLSSVLLLQILFYKSKEIVHTSSKIITQSKKEKESKDILFKDTANNAPKYITVYHYVHSDSTQVEMPEEETISPNNMTERKDSVRLSNPPMSRKQEIIQGTENRKNWSLALSVSGVNRQTNTQRMMIPGGVSSEKPQEVTKKSYYHIPITLSLSLHKRINERWGIETGLRYTYLRADFTTITDSHWKETQKINYIGIPLKGLFNVGSRQKFSFYLSAGVTLDIPIKATSKEIVSDENGKIISDKKSYIQPPLQWSTNLGIGVQYQITPSIGIYAEPNLHYYFKTKHSIKTIRTEKPFQIALPIGIRLSW